MWERERNQSRWWEERKLVWAVGSGKWEMELVPELGQLTYDFLAEAALILHVRKARSLIP